MNQQVYKKSYDNPTAGLVHNPRLEYGVVCIVP